MITQPGFDVERFISDCRDAVAGDLPEKAVREVMMRALANAAAVRDRLGAPRAQIQILHRGTDLVILNAIWAPRMAVPPHNHTMWAITGLYDGREDNIFWRRIGDAPGGCIEAVGAKALSTGECTTLGPDIIHSVLNPSARFSGALHVYGGDFANVARSVWDSDTLQEGPYDAQNAMRDFVEASMQVKG